MEISAKTTARHVPCDEAIKDKADDCGSIEDEREYRYDICDACKAEAAEALADAKEAERKRVLGFS